MPYSSRTTMNCIFLYSRDRVFRVNLQNISSSNCNVSMAAMTSALFVLNALNMIILEHAFRLSPFVANGNGGGCGMWQVVESRATNLDDSVGVKKIVKSFRAKQLCLRPLLLVLCGILLKIHYTPRCHWAGLLLCICLP